ncbi:MAG: class I SAM-dependent methyltransferase [Firmicutes bacterium]|nr:class I SAM-dependent methyltransferase [Bacillota bacterium]
MSELVLPVCDMIHREADKLLFEGAIAVDGTMGNGFDTLFLCQKVGKKGKVYGFDIQPSALENTKVLLENNDCAEQAVLIEDSHHRMDEYIKTNIDCAIFNLGYLPKGDHLITTQKETTVSALEKTLSLLNPGGAVFIALYWGHPGGEEERSAVEEFASHLSPSQWDVSETSFLNKNRAPLMMIIQKKTR